MVWSKRKSFSISWNVRYLYCIEFSIHLWYVCQGRCQILRRGTHRHVLAMYLPLFISTFEFTECVIYLLKLIAQCFNFIADISNLKDPKSYDTSRFCWRIQSKSWIMKYEKTWELEWMIINIVGFCKTLGWLMIPQEASVEQPWSVSIMARVSHRSTTVQIHIRSKLNKSKYRKHSIAHQNTNTNTNSHCNK